MLGELVDAFIAEQQQNAGKRWEVTRTGERAYIPWLLRLSIYRRDGFACKTCGATENLELDHCLPWSAGGPDDSDNLRVLCGPCNQRRSNYWDHAVDTKYRPTTWWCAECWTEEKSLARPLWRDGTDLNRAPLVSNPIELAYCAWCDWQSFTDLAFVGEPGRLLIEMVTPPEAREVRYAK